MASKLAVSGLVLIGLGVALAAAYQLGRSNAAAGAGRPRCRPAMRRAAPQREGKVGADAAQKFTHFRVGNKNVKRIHADGDVIWVGTSGGVVRYDTRRDDYKLYDTQSGLLSNGVFFVGKLGDRIAVGTYGGGLALLDAEDRAMGNVQRARGPGRRLRLRRAEDEERRCLDRHLVGRQPHQRRRL